MRYRSFPKHGWCRFYMKDLYKRCRQIDRIERSESHFDYTKCNITRREIGWGQTKVIGYYADYIRSVNHMRPKRNKPKRQRRKLRLP